MPSSPLLFHATSLADKNGTLTGSYAFITDLSQIYQRQRELDLTRHAVAHSFDEILRVAPDGSILNANEAACRNLGYTWGELMELTISDIDPNYPAQVWKDRWQDLRHHKSLAFETEHQTKDGTIFPVEVAVSHLTYEGEAFAYAVARDISERRAAEEASQRANRALKALSQVNAALVHSNDEQALFREVCQTLTQSQGYPLAWIGIAEDDPDRKVRVAEAAGWAQGYLQDLEISWADKPTGHGPAGRAIRTGEVQVLRQLDQASAFAPWRGAANAYGFRAAIALPVRVENRIIATLITYSTDPKAFDAEEQSLLQELASDLGLGIQTIRTRAERDRQMTELRLAGTVFENTPEGIMVTDPDTRIEMVNGAFTRITGYTAEEAIGQTPAMLQSGLQDEAFYRGMWAAIHEQGQWQGEIWNRRKNGKVYPEWLSISEVRDEAGELTNFVAVFADVSQAHQTQEELTFRTYHDPLTELPNRALFRERLGHAIESGHEQLAVALIDLKGFRALNDSFGAEGGDAVLKQTAQRLANALPEGDTVARPGGDEFWILMEDLPRSQVVEQRLRALNEAVSEPLKVADQTVRLEAHVGVALFPEDGTNREGLLTSAATALHRAQGEGESRIQYFSPAMHQTVQRRVRMAEALKGALEQDELEVWYQAKVNLASGSATGLEALVRWRHPDWGLISPAEFIPLAEETGLVGSIGDWVLERALAQCVAWRQAGYSPGRIAVNAAPAQIQQTDWSSRVAAMLEHTGAPAECLEIEVTEESVLANLTEAVTTMNRLKDQGVHLALDDFGTGYSSLAYLKELPLDTLKIDKAFIDGLPDVDHDRSITEAILAVANALDLDVVAEGVETLNQANWLLDHGVRLAQGFLYHKPQEAGQVTTWMAS